MVKMLEQISNQLYNQKSVIEQWLEVRLAGLKLLYSSQDIRNAGFKIAPVDVNYFPAGFNNLSTSALQICQKEIDAYVKEIYPDTKKIVIIAENFSRNNYYLQNVRVIKDLFTAIGFAVTVTTFSNEGNLEDLAFSSMQTELKGLDKKTGLIVLNNDLTNGVPDILADKELQILPPIKSGWYNRSKSFYFEKYQQVVRDFAIDFEIDPFFFTPLSESCRGVNFKTRQGMEELAEKVDSSLQQITELYSQHGISQKPYVVIKSDSGTFGMAIMKASSGDDVININKKQRQKMSVGKGGVHTDNVIIQEGIHTIEKYNNYAAESMVYSVGRAPVSLIYRFHHEKNELSILNTVGMEFAESYLFEQGQKEFFLHYLVSKLSLVAANNEIKSFDEDAKI